MNTRSAVFQSPINPAIAGPPTSSGQHLLLPHRAPSTRAQRTRLVDITSRDRNYLSLVAPNPMRFTFQTPLRDVRSVELISGVIPACPYNIVDGANTFQFKEISGNDLCATNDFLITIPPGYYTTATLIQKLNDMFCGLCGVNTYSWGQDPETGSLVLLRKTGTARFNLNFLSGYPEDTIDRCDGNWVMQNTPATILGFDLSEYVDNCGVILSPYPIDLASSMNRIYLYINFENSLSLSVIERGSGRKDPFAIIYLDDERNGYKYLNKETITPVMYSLPQPFSRLQNLYIDFRDEWYRPINFNGKDFHLQLQFTVLE